jgi:uncharacterized damage-inducible protein DinB
LFDSGFKSEEGGMEYKTFFLEQLKREQVANGKILPRVPEGKNDYKPHERSMPMGYLASLVAQMPAWIAMMLNTDGLDLDDAKSSGEFSMEPAKDTAALVKLSEESYAKGKAALEAATDDKFAGHWAFRMGGKELQCGPRHSQIADVFTHLAHHRGQLTVYVRLNNRKVPAIYGPSADERLG